MLPSLMTIHKSGTVMRAGQTSHPMVMMTTMMNKLHQPGQETSSKTFQSNNRLGYLVWGVELALFMLGAFEKTL